MAQVRTPATEEYSWAHFVGLSGEEGERWLKEYVRHEPVVDMNFECLMLIKDGLFDAAAAHLRLFRERVDAAESDEPSIRPVLERWYQAVYGYYWYVLEEYDEADRAMTAAADACGEAIALQPCLLPMADHCPEFRMHRARIARNQRRWSEMWEHTEEVRAMFRGERPLCVLPDGRGIVLPEVKRYYAALAVSTDGEREALSHKLDDQVRMRDFDRFVQQMMRLPGFVIAYP
jgi:hypothetical protein